MKTISFPFPEEDFEVLLQKVLDDRNLMTELLRHSEFLERGYMIVCWHVRDTKEDAREVFANAFLKTMIAKDKLRSDNTPNAEAFFGWFSQVTLNMLRDKWRKDNRELKRLRPLSNSEEESSDEDNDNDIPDPRIDLYGEYLLEEFWEFTNTLPAKYRQAVILRLKNYPDKGYSYEEIAKQLNSMGVKCTPPSVRSWVRTSLKAFFDGSRVSSDKKAVAF